jgi:hypothetical protein
MNARDPWQSRPTSQYEFHWHIRRLTVFSIPTDTHTQGIRFDFCTGPHSLWIGISIPVSIPIPLELPEREGTTSTRCYGYS